MSDGRAADAIRDGLKRSYYEGYLLALEDADELVLSVLEKDRQLPEARAAASLALRLYRQRVAEGEFGRDQR